MGWNGTIFRKYITDENCSIEHKTEKKSHKWYIVSRPRTERL